jgi:hypothetical protein
VGHGEQGGGELSLHVVELPLGVHHRKGGRAWAHAGHKLGHVHLHI